MRKMKMHNFHVPLPDDLYNKLRNEAEKSNRPATELARVAIQQWLKEKQRQILHKSISDYTSHYAGTDSDLDLELSEASMDFLMKEEVY